MMEHRINHQSWIYIPTGIKSCACVLNLIADCRFSQVVHFPTHNSNLLGELLIINITS